MLCVDPSGHPEPPDDGRPPGQAPAEPADPDEDEPAHDEVEIVDDDEFGEPVDESAVNDDDDWDPTEI